jgi:hypothetical protein
MRGVAPWMGGAALVLGLGAGAVAGVPGGTCPGPDRLKVIANQLYGGSMPACTPVRGRHGRAMVMGRAANASDHHDWIYAMVDAGGTVLLDSRAVARAADGDVAWNMIDLDGDGDDELVEQVSTTARIGIGIGRQRINVYAIGDGAPVLGGSLTISDTLSDRANGCPGTYRYASDGKRQRIEVDSTTQTDPKRARAPATCAPPGRHHYGWDGARLNEVPVTAPAPRPAR